MLPSQVRPRPAHDPVVVLTTSEAEEDVLQSYYLHANAYVTKPVDFDRFVRSCARSTTSSCGGTAAELGVG